MRRENSEFFPGQIDHIPFRHGGVKRAFFENGQYRKIVPMRAPPPHPLGRRPTYNQFPFPRSKQLGKREIKPQNRLSLTGKTSHAKYFHFVVGRNLPDLLVREGFGIAN